MDDVRVENQVSKRFLGRLAMVCVVTVVPGKKLLKQKRRHEGADNEEHDRKQVDGSFFGKFDGFRE